MKNSEINFLKIRPQLVQLPEVLLIHLKRFRHDYLLSSKIGQHVSYPLTGLDLTPYLHRGAGEQVRQPEGGGTVFSRVQATL